jgi:23S rRNA (adenine2030-N6)-methyltransferase
MNYRHHFHAGNFADVFKHTLLVQLFRGLQRKEKGILYLDTHAGRGRYDLTEAERGDTLARKPEFPEGVGRIWTASTAPSPIAEYVALVRRFDQSEGNVDATAPRFYPGSPWLARLLARPQDRLALCEKHPEELEALRVEFSRERNVSVHALDGYTALRAMLPPPEKRALVLIDPPFEQRGEFADIVGSLREGLDRLPAGTFAVWYPLTERARVDDFLAELLALNPPPTFTAEIQIAGDTSEIKMKGCGLVVINPPWQIDREIIPVLPWLAERLAQAPGGGAELRWLVREK